MCQTMKCPTCGANLQIEDEICPFCGNPNPFAVKHDRDMRHYRQEFQETKREVERRTLHFNTFTARIAVIAVLLVMVMGMVFAINDGAYYLWSSRVKKDVAKNTEKYRAELNVLEEAGEWRRLHAFYDAKSLDSTRDLKDYTVLYFMIYDYKSILNEITRLQEDDVDDLAAAASKMSSHLDNFYKAVGRISYESAYYDDCYSKTHMASYERMQEELEAVLSVYCHLTDEEISVLPDYSLVKRAGLIEEGLCREAEKKEVSEE